MRLKIHFKNVSGMVTSWTCKFWLEFWVCARGIPYPGENADIPAGIGVCPTSEGNPFSHCPWDRKEKWEIEALLRNGWKGCWEWECLNSSDVSKFMDLILGITPGIPAWYPQHILGMPLPPFPVFSIQPGPFAMPGTPLKVIRKQIFPGNLKAFPGHSSGLQLFPLQENQRFHSLPEPGCFK